MRDHRHHVSDLIVAALDRFAPNTVVTLAYEVALLYSNYKMARDEDMETEDGR